MQGDKELERLLSPFRLLQLWGCKLVAGVFRIKAPRRYSAPCMLQESPSVQIVLMCLMERRSPRMAIRTLGDPRLIGVGKGFWMSEGEDFRVAN